MAIGCALAVSKPPLCSFIGSVAFCQHECLLPQKPGLGAMKDRPSCMNSVSAVRRAMLAVVLVALPFNVATAASPILWTLKTPAGTDALSGWRLPAPPPTAGGLQPILPDPTGGVVVDDAAPLPQDFSIAPSVDNILNRRRDLSEDQMGLDGSSDTYLRSVGRTFGLAIKKALY